MKVVIAGAGIAGPAAAIALAEACIAAQLVEAREAPEGEQDLSLTIASNGHRVLKDPGLDASVRGHPHIRTPRIAFLGARGKRLGMVSNRRGGRDVPITLMRHSLHRALARIHDYRVPQKRHGQSRPDRKENDDD